MIKATEDALYVLALKYVTACDNIQTHKEFTARADNKGLDQDALEDERITLETLKRAAATELVDWLTRSK